MSIAGLIRSAVSVGLILASGASASTAIQVSLADMAWLAEFIYAGTVSDTTCSVSDDGMSVTEYRFSNLDVVKSGKYGAAGRLRLAGTPPGNIIGQPTLELGARYIVFSAPEFYSAGKGRGAIVGLNQGLFRVGIDYRGKADAILDSNGRPVVEVKEGRIVVVGAADGARRGRSRFKATEGAELPPKRPRNLPPAAPPLRPPGASQLMTDATPPAARPRPPDPPELDYVKARWESRPRSVAGRRVVEVIVRAADKGARLSESEFLQAVRAMIDVTK